MLFFLFKQKTAYEMRISDWSSDVCSSDLRQAPAQDQQQDRDQRDHGTAEPDPQGVAEDRQLSVERAGVIDDADGIQPRLSAFGIDPAQAEAEAECVRTDRKSVV